MNLNHIRIGLLCTVAVFTPSLVLAQAGATPNQPSQPQQQPGTMPGGGGMAGSMGASAGGETENQMMMDKMFVHKALEGGMGEIQLGQLASQKASNGDVKSFGQKMVDDHTALNNDMKAIADSMGVHVPTKLNKQDQAELDKLNGLSGADFDKEYLAYADKGHHKDLSAFKTEANSTTDPNLKAAVEKGQKVVWQHTKMVDQLAQANGVPVADHGKS
jgi:putative membrane protein